MLFSNFKKEMFISSILIITIISTLSMAQEETNELLKYSREGNLEMVQYLIAQGADPNGEYGYSIPLVEATLGYHFDVMRFLLQAEAYPNPYRLTDYECTLIISLLESRSLDDSLLEAVRILLEGEANPNVHSGHLFNVTALILASKKAGSDNRFFRGDESLKLTQLLLEYEADPNERDNEGRTALMYAEFKEGAELLLAFGADLNMQDNDGHTPLMYASRSRQSNLDLINTLLEWGADIDITDNEGQTAITLAKNQEIVQYLENWGK